MSQDQKNRVSYVPLLGLIVTALSLTVSAMVFFLGSGYPLRIAERSFLRYTVHQQLFSDSIYLNACTFENLGSSNATNVVIEIGSASGASFLDLSIDGAAGSGGWFISSGGTGDDHATIRLDRLVPDSSLITTVQTEEPIVFECIATDDSGRATTTMPPSPLFTLGIGDFAVIIAVMLVLIIMVFAVSRRWAVSSTTTKES